MVLKKWWEGPSSTLHFFLDKIKYLCNNNYVEIEVGSARSSKRASEASLLFNDEKVDKLYQ